MLDIDNHKDDPYLVEFTKRRVQGTASPLDRANTALLNASQAATIMVGAPDDDSLSVRHGEDYCKGIEALVDRVALAASAVAIAERQGDDELAADFAKVAESEALTLDSFAYAKVDGLKRHEVHGA